MGLDDKIDNASQDTAGKVKEGVGRATDNERLEAEGRQRPGGRQAQAGRREDQGRLQELSTRRTHTTGSAHGPARSAVYGR